ncbi:MAG: ATPase, T2SS/T4P/T4SS family [Candidatus Woesearchaeota archaeon]|jgi:ATPase|nr:ATPase, T2SS/T4P/T4SS family [Candidatus Woesearchaeota archaeon]
MVNKYAITINAFLEGILVKLIEEDLNIDELYLPRFFVSYFEELKRNSVLRGNIGLNELSLIKELSIKKKFKVVFFGESSVRSENIEVKCREGYMSLESDLVVLVASDEEKKVYDLFDIKTQVLSVNTKMKNPLKVFFDKETMSVHIKERDFVYLKKGSPMKIDFVKSKTKLDNAKIVKLIDEVLEFARLNESSYIEKDSGNVVLAQIEDIRVVIVRPPLSEGYEITAVRPIEKLILDDYKLDEKIISKLDIAEGVLISGSPGSGKSTFCQALAEHLADLEKIVKTIESPRDLQLSERITQFSLSHSQKGDLANILLLSRPDYSIYDEVRNPEDIELYSDLRLAGVGMVGVIHATKPIDSIHRLIGKIEMGMIPQIVDTVIFMKKGAIEKILVLESTVKVPSGMQEADLARPVIEIKDYMTNVLEYEIYTYGEQTVVFELSKITKKTKDSSAQKIAKEHIEKELKKLDLPEFEFEFESDNRIKLKIPEKFAPEIIGREGKNIDALEKKIGIKISIEKLSIAKKELKDVNFSIQQTKTNIVFNLKSQINYYEMFHGGDVIASGNVGRQGALRVKRKSYSGKLLENLLDNGEIITIKGI